MLGLNPGTALETALLECRRGKCYSQAEDEMRGDNGVQKCARPINFKDVTLREESKQ